jgi:hypothetical protein
MPSRVVEKRGKVWRRATQSKQQKGPPTAPCEAAKLRPETHKRPRSRVVTTKMGSDRQGKPLLCICRDLPRHKPARHCRQIGRWCLYFLISRRRCLHCTYVVAPIHTRPTAHDHGSRHRHRLPRRLQEGFVCQRGARPRSTRLTPTSVDDADHKHGLPDWPSHPRLQPQKGRLKVPARCPLHRHVPRRGPRRPRCPPHSQAARRLPAAQGHQGLHKRPALLRLLEQADALLPRAV